MQSVGIASPGHHPAGELVDDHDVVIADDVVLIAREELMRAERLVHMVHQADAFGLVERALLGQEAHLL